MIAAFALALTPTLTGTPALSQIPGPLPPGALPCLTTTTPAGFGSLLLVESAAFEQSGDTPPAELATPAPVLFAEILSPGAFVISNALLANTRGFSLPLAYQPSGRSSGTTNFASEAALNAAVPSGAWNTSFQLVFTNSDSFVGFSVFNLASNTPPVPRIANLAAAQAINPATAFTLQWDAWAAAGTNDRVSLVITDAAGTVVAATATDCAAPVPLAPGDTAFTVPAGTLNPGSTYSAHLTFAAHRLADVDDGALLARRAFHSRTTRFTIRTSGSGSSGEPGDLSRPTLTPSAVLLTLTGTPGTTYAIQASSNLIDWSEQTRSTVPAAGTIDVTLPLPPPGAPRFYRAVSVGGGGTPGSGASLAIAATSPTRMRITITAPAGSTHVVESSTNFTTWTEVGTITIPEGSTNVAFTAAVPAGSRSAVFRARTDGITPPPPPPGNTPTLAASRSATGVLVELSGGDPNHTYTLLQASPGLDSWAATTFTITTGPDGSGQVVINPTATTSGVFRTDNP